MARNINDQKPLFKFRVTLPLMKEKRHNSILIES